MIVYYLVQMDLKVMGTIDTDNPSGVVYNNNIPPGTLVPTDWFEYYGLDYTPEEVYDDKGNLMI